MTIEINGVAHVILTVSRFEVAREFYRKLLPEFGMKQCSTATSYSTASAHETAIGIEPCDPALAGERFVQQRAARCLPESCAKKAWSWDPPPVLRRRSPPKSRM